VTSLSFDALSLANAHK